MRQIVKAKDSRAMAADMDKPPFTDLPIKDQFEIRNMYGYEMVTYEDFLRILERYMKKMKQ